jgi:hypothetical protein
MDASAAQEPMIKGEGVAHFTRPKTITIVGPMATRLDCSTLALPAPTARWVNPAATKSNIMGGNTWGSEFL